MAGNPAGVRNGYPTKKIPTAPSLHIPAKPPVNELLITGFIRLQFWEINIRANKQELDTRRGKNPLSDPRAICLKYGSTSLLAQARLSI